MHTKKLVVGEDARTLPARAVARWWRNAWVLWIGLAAVFAAGASAQEFGGWGASQTVAAVTPLGSDLCAGDFDGDGLQDIAYFGRLQIGSNVTVLRVMYGIGTAQPADFVTHLTPGTALTSGVHAADLNGDGIDDLVVPHNPTTGGGNGGMTAIRIYFGTAERTLTLASTSILTGEGLSPLGSTLVDIDSDGDQDILVLKNLTNNPVQNQIWLIENLGAGSFAKPRVIASNPAGGSWRNLAAGDFDGDGRAEIITHQASSTSLRVLRDATDSGMWTEFMTLPLPTNSPATTLAVADFNQDGRLDIAATTVGGVRVLIGNGHLGFTPADSNIAGLNTGSQTRAGAIGDLDGDGDLDIVALREDGGFMTLLNDGSGHFAPSASVSDGVAGLIGLRLVDIDGNSTPDLVRAYTTSQNRLHFSLNQTDVVPPGPFTLLSPGDNLTALPLPEELTWPGNEARISWSAPSGFSVGYTLRISERADLSDPRFEVTTTGRSVALPAGSLDAGRRYYWGVTAATQAGETPAANGPRTFTTNCPADVNRDLIINFFDVAAFLSIFGEGCP